MNSQNPSDLLGEEDENAIRTARTRLQHAINTLDEKCEAIATKQLPGDAADLAKMGRETGAALDNLIAVRERLGKLGDKFGCLQDEAPIDFDAIRDQVRGALDNIRASKEAE